jgi:hypothetical protein
MAAKMRKKTGPQISLFREGSSGSWFNWKELAEGQPQTTQNSEMERDKNSGLFSAYFACSAVNSPLDLLAASLFVIFARPPQSYGGWMLSVVKCSRFPGSNFVDHRLHTAAPQSGMILLF